MRNIFKQLMFVLNRKQKIICCIIFVTSFVGSMLELLGITAILPFINVLLNPDSIKEYEYVRELNKYIEFKDNKTIIIGIGILIILVYIFKNVYLILQFKFQLKNVNKIRWDLSNSVIRSYMKRDYLFHTQTNSSVLLRGIDTDVSATTDVLSNLFRACAEFITVMLIIVYLVYTNVLLSLMAAGVMTICLFWFLFCYRMKIREAGKRYNIYAAHVSQCALQIFGGIKEIMVNHREEYFISKYTDLLQIRINSETEKGVYEKKPPYIYEAVSVSAFIGIICVMVLVDLKIESLVPVMAVFAVAAFRIISSTGRISSSLNGVIFSRQGLNNIYINIKEIRKQQKNTQHHIEEREISESSEKKLTFERCLQIENISWRYPERTQMILNDVNMVIKKGESAAFIGPSGAGKTTLADIILGLLKPEQGRVLVDDQNINDETVLWAKMIGYVPQNAYLIDDTVRHNIAFGIPEEKIDDQAIMRALEQAQLKTFIDGLDKGIETIVGETGIQFSGGQRQRIAIARALYNDPDILVLDEATSALDNETESAVMEAIDHLRGVKTLIIIAHRISTTTKCNKVYEIKNGKVTCIRDSDNANKEKSI